MANFFSADYWKALFFKAMGGQATASDPNAMSGSFAGVAAFTGTLSALDGSISGTFVGTSSWTGTLDQPGGAISGTFAGTSEFTGTLSDGAASTLRGRLIRRRRLPDPIDPPTPEEVAETVPEPVVVALPEPKKKIKKGFLVKLGKEPEYQQAQTILELAQRAAAADANRRAIDDLNVGLKAIGAPLVNAVNAADIRLIVGAIIDEAMQRLAEIEEEDEEVVMLLLMAA